MFYHLEILKKTGPFYPLWLADTYPKRFLRIPENKIWSYNISDICENLTEILKTETMNPRKRFSLRLSARLTYGVIKLYERQSHLLLHSVFNLNMGITKRRNVEDEKQKKKPPKKSTSGDEQHNQPIQNAIAPQAEEQLISEADVIRMLNASQQVQNAEISLRENQLLPTEMRMENFGEEVDPMAIFQQENVLQKMDGSVMECGESILVPVMVHREGDITPQPQMKDVSHIDKMIIQEESEIQISSKDMEIVRVNETILQNETVPEIQVSTPRQDPIPPPIDVQHEQPPQQDNINHYNINLDETPVLETNVTLPVPKKRKRIIKDALIVLNHEYMRSRIQNIQVDLRCKHPLLDAMNIEAAVSELRFHLSKTAFDGSRRLIFKIKRTSEALRKAYSRNLVTRTVADDKSSFRKQKQIEQMRGRNVTESSRNISMLNIPINIDEQHTILMPNDNVSVLIPSPKHISVLNMQDKSLLPLPEITIPELDLTKDTTIEKTTASQKKSDKPSVTVTTTIDDIRQDISKGEKRKRNANKTTDGKKVNSREQTKEVVEDNVIEKDKEVELILPMDVQNFQMEIINAGLPIDVDELNKIRDETMLGSLDRTRVSLGDSGMTQEDKIIKEYLEKEWGNMGVWEKIVRAKQQHCYPLNVEVLVERSQIPQNISKRRVAVNAFKVLLFMKRYQIIKIDKNPDLTIANIKRGNAVKKLSKK